MEFLSNHSSLAGLLPISGAFALQTVRLSWPEVVWAYEAGIVGWRSLTEFAKVGLDAKPEEDALTELAHLAKNDAGRAGDLAKTLANTGKPLNAEMAQKKWLYVVLKSLYDRKDQFPDPLALIEEIYAGFGYPEAIEDLVRWMPAKEPLTDQLSGAGRIERNWRSYLDRAAAEFQKLEQSTP